MNIAGRALIALLLVVSAASMAAAQTPPPGGDERPTLNAGPFELRPRLVFHSIGVDNNVFNEAEDPKSDFTFGVQPDLEVTAKPGPVRIMWTVATDFLWYRKYTSERTANRSTSLNVDVLLRALRPFFTVSLSDTNARPSPEIDARARRRPRTYSAGATLRFGTRSNIGFKYSNGRERYEEDEQFRGESLARTLNNETQTFEGSLGMAFTPLTSFSVVVGHDEVTFQQETQRNATSLRIAPTLTFNPAGTVHGTASVGFKSFDGDDPAMPEYKGLAMNGSLSFLLGQRYRFETRFTRDVQYSYEEALPYYVLTGARATLARQMTNVVDFRLTAGHERMRYRAYGDAVSPGSDRQYVFGGGIGFRIGDRKRFVVQAEFVERNSNRDRIREFGNHRIFGSLTWGA